MTNHQKKTPFKICTKLIILLIDSQLKVFTINTKFLAACVNVHQTVVLYLISCFKKNSIGLSVHSICCSMKQIEIGASAQ